MAEPSPVGEPLQSAFAGDPDMDVMVELFVDEMPDRVAAIGACWREQRWDDLQRLAHSLKGAAGGYGFEPITDAAARLEQAVRERDEAARLKSAVDELVDLCRRAAA